MFRIATLMTTVVILLINTFTVHAQGPPSNYENLQGLEPLIGEWTGETQLQQDIPGLAKKGAPATVPLACEWDLNKNVIRVEWSYVVNGKTIQVTKAMIGWDPLQSKIVNMSFNSLGGRSQGIWNKTGDSWVLKYSGADGAASTITGTFTWKEISANKLIGQFTDQTIAGKTLEDKSETEFNRVK